MNTAQAAPSSLAHSKKPHPRSIHVNDQSRTVMLLPSEATEMPLAAAGNDLLPFISKRLELACVEF